LEAKSAACQEIADDVAALDASAKDLRALEARVSALASESGDAGGHREPEEIADDEENAAAELTSLRRQVEEAATKEINTERKINSLESELNRLTQSKLQAEARRQETTELEKKYFLRTCGH